MSTRIVSVFGGSAPRAGSAAYEEARALGGLLAGAGWTVATGGYTGVMEAASRGACEAGGHVIGVTCTLIENWRKLKANEWVREEKRFETLRERLNYLVEFCDAAIALPGGIGTLSEVALTWSLLQTGELKAKPLILLGAVWQATVTAFLREAGEAYLRPGDDRLVYLAADAPDALRALSEVAEANG
jgi:uncharacterized protein (TIGR00730 family)